MEHRFWAERWQEGRIGFHLADVNPSLTRHWAAFRSWLGAGSSSNVLIPLCGKTLDLTWLSEQGHAVTGVEFVETAARQYFEERGSPAQRSQLGRALEYRANDTRILVADFFDLGRDHVGPVHCVYDRAALVAIAPERRREYVRQLWQLLETGGGVLLITFEHDMGSGPPFSIDDVPELFAPRRADGGGAFDIEHQETREILEVESRFRERGATFMKEVVWYARKR